MRALAEKLKATLQPGSPKAAAFARSNLSYGELDSGSSGATTTSRFEHDFCRTPAIGPKTGPIPMRPLMGNTGEQSEQETYCDFERAMRMPDRASDLELPRPLSIRTTGGLDSAHASCMPLTTRLQEVVGEQYIQRAISLASTPQDIEPVIAEGRSHADPLAIGVRVQMEAAFGCDFSSVRVHTDEASDRLARAVQARAFATGQDIFFRLGEYNPGSRAGRELLAHELAHVAQQSTAPKTERLTISQPGDRLEQEANEAARRVIDSEGLVELSTFPIYPSLARQATTTENSQPGDETEDLVNEDASAEAEERFGDEEEAPPIQRKIMIATGGAATPWREMTRAQRRAFIRRRRSEFGNTNAALARRILEDMAAAGDELRYDDENELAREIHKRIVTSRVMRSSQTAGTGGLRGFGYPFRPPAQWYGPRVNYSARESWEPAVSDSYAARTDPGKRDQIRHSQNDPERADVYGDPSGDYEFTLTPTGLRNPYQALVSLFVPQPPRRRTLIHCDYLVTLVHYRAFADSLGEAEFNRRVQVRTIPMVLRWNGFDNISRGPTASTGAVSLRVVQPAGPGDLVIGDHVYFFNHIAYDPLIAGVGGVWRLENAVLEDRINGIDYFEGHGSGRDTANGIKNKLRRQFNNHVDQANGMIRETERGTTDHRANALIDFQSKFSRLRLRSGRYFIVGNGIFGTPVDFELRRVSLDEIPGLYDPRQYVDSTNPGTMYKVRRPVESE